MGCPVTAQRARIPSGGSEEMDLSVESERIRTNSNTAGAGEFEHGEFEHGGCRLSQGRIMGPGVGPTQESESRHRADPG